MLIDINGSQITLPIAGFRIECGKGTYIRSLARDLGNRLGTKAYLGSLRRVSSGDFDVDKAMKSSYLTQIIESGEYRKDADMA
jgi:tRNA pseudouridine55 synthase